MKKCPYCAEEIQDEAIVCRYCGRDLVPISEQTPLVTAPAPVATKVTPSVWKQGATASAVVSILYIIGQLSTPKSVPDLIGNLTFGLIATFLFWWLIFAIIVALWRKLGPGTFWLLLLGIGLIAFAYLYNSVNNVSTPVPLPPVPTATLRPLPTTTKVVGAALPPLKANCVWWSTLRGNNVGENKCVQGIVTKIIGNTESNASARIYFGSFALADYTLSDGTPTVFYFLDETYYYSNLKVGDCVTAIGFIRTTNDGLLFMRLNGNLDTCN